MNEEMCGANHPKNEGITCQKEKGHTGVMHSCDTPQGGFMMWQEPTPDTVQETPKPAPKKKSKRLVNKTCPDCGGDGIDCKTCDTSGEVKTVETPKITGFEPIVPDKGERPKVKREKKVNPNAKPCSHEGCKVIDALHYVIGHIGHHRALAKFSCGRHLNGMVSLIGENQTVRSIEIVHRSKVIRLYEVPVVAVNLTGFNLTDEFSKLPKEDLDTLKEAFVAPESSLKVGETTEIPVKTRVIVVDNPKD